MTRCLLLCLAASWWSIPALRGADLAPGLEAERFSPDDWPWWRGPRRDGIADAGQQPPLAWSATENVAWQAATPGRGHGSPIVVGDQVILATSESARGTQSLVCYARRDGRRLWEAVCHSGGLDVGGHAKSSLAAATPACDGERIFINFLHAGAVHATAVSRDGRVEWQTKVGDYAVHQGFGASPAVYGPLVIVAADHQEGGAVVGLDRQTGREVWRHARPKLPNYASPVVHRADGRDQLLLAGCDRVASLDPLTGAVLWEVPGATTECVTTAVCDGRVVLTSGGFPRNHLAAVRVDGDHAVAWENATRIYVPSLLMHAGYVYGVTDAGVAMCWQAETGREQWKGRLGGVFSASPVKVGPYLFAVNEEGTTFVFRAAPEAFELVGRNQLGDLTMATPVFSRGQAFFRVAHREGEVLQETLYCIGRPPR